MPKQTLPHKLGESVKKTAQTDPLLSVCFRCIRASHSPTLRCFFFVIYARPDESTRSPVGLKNSSPSTTDRYHDGKVRIHVENSGNISSRLTDHHCH